MLEKFHLTPKRIRGWIMQNPVILKEMRNRMRGNRAYVILTLYLLMLSGVVALIYLTFDTSANVNVTLDIRKTLGKTIFGTSIGFQLMTISFIAPALTASAISSEREHQTFDLLRTTLLPARSLVLGKMNSALFFILLLLFTTFPLTSIAFLFGGVTLAEFVIGSLILFVTAVAYCAIGVFFSSFTRRTLISTVMAYAFTVVLVFGLPIFIGMFGAFFGASVSSITGTLNDAFTLLLGGILYLMVAINPVTTAIASEIILLENDSMFFTTVPFNGMSLPIISPWIVYAALYLALSLALLLLSVWFVRRVEQ